MGLLFGMRMGCEIHPIGSDRPQWAAGESGITTENLFVGQVQLYDNNATTKSVYVYDKSALPHK